MTNQNQSEVRYWTIYEGEYLIVTEPKGPKQGCHVVLKSDYDKLKEENQRLRGEVEFLNELIEESKK